MIDLGKDYLLQIQDILAREVPDYEVRAFGSRVTNNAEPFSDLDLVLIGDTPLSPQRLFTLKSRFSETNLPILIDVVEWRTLDESFQKIVDENSVLIRDERGRVTH